MLGGNQLYRSALGGCLIGAILWLSATPALAPPEKAEDRAYTQHGADQTKQTPAPQQEVPVDVIPAAEPISSGGANSSGAQDPADDSETEKQRAQADLEAQQDMVLWAKWMVVVSAVSVVIAGVAVYLVFLTLREAGKTTKAARATVDETKKITAAAIAANDLHERVARQAERAWLRVDAELLDNVQFNEGGDASFRVKFMVENIGNSPAFAVDVHAKVYLFAPEWDRPDIAQLKFARTIRDFEQNDRGAIVFPGDDWKRTPVLKIWSSDAKRARKQTEEVDGTDDGYLRPIIIGCVQYLTRPNDTQPNQTGFIYAIRVRQEGSSPTWLPDGMSFSREDVVLETRSLDPHAVT